MKQPFYVKIKFDGTSEDDLSLLIVAESINEIFSQYLNGNLTLPAGWKSFEVTSGRHSSVVIL